ncbi:MAG: glutamate formimidoyltransferase [Erysipelotrichaceae bacterium]|nr:glutamate formimidoyltransferase [Erysipelotrichaceae bacterium]
MRKLVEFIPNFSVSSQKDEETFNRLVEVAQSVPGCTLLDAQSDGSHNRSVFTMTGSPQAIEEVAFRLCKKAAETIDLRKHQGAHPRMGATDVMPFVPTQDVSLEECIALSKRVAERIWNELKIPCFLYEDSCSSEERRNLATIRRGEFEGMAEKLLLPEWQPDYGDRKPHPTAGVTAVGARMPLVAFNVNLDSDDLEIAKTIAKTIRGSSGGFKYCKAMGVRIEETGKVQVSMNMVNYEKTALYETFDAIKKLAGEAGISITGSEIVGLTPAKALIDVAAHYLKLEGFDCYKQVMEYHLGE